MTMTTFLFPNRLGSYIEVTSSLLRQGFEFVILKKSLTVRFVANCEARIPTGSLALT